MMHSARIIAMTQHPDMTPEEFVAYCARVSNPTNQHNHATASRLLRYLVTHKHWSPFEMVTIVMEVTTTRDIARQILRHRSFSFQEFSQRYADPTESLGFAMRELRYQDPKNRQSSIDADDHDVIHGAWLDIQDNVMTEAKKSYDAALALGIAKEQARALLPEGLTISRLYMSGSLRSWLHYCAVRCDAGTQKEHRQVAESAKATLCDTFPSLEDVWQ